MSKVYSPLIKDIVVQGHKFQIKALTFEDLKVLSSLNQSDAVGFTKTVMDRAVLGAEADVSTLPIPIYVELLKEIMEFSGLGQTNIFNPSLRQQTP